MTRPDVITIIVIVAGLLVLIKFSGLKVWHALVVFGVGFYLATTPAGASLLAEANRVLAALGH